MIITIIGAGSVVFTRNLVEGLFRWSEFQDAGITIRLMDINSGRLRTANSIATQIVQKLGVKAIVEAYDDQVAALTGARYIL